ncbi:proliferation-associated protein 2G4 isoform X2 [Hydra vulgaris]|uniref:proliferation-associated protein 2G4 isoform X2 n=1 Tax=Hydra vulgaris TaxID=6087 RepID=UPI001F5FB0A4|nr:proliferation-associated protein 2G4 [Hydra vulgaris]
MADKDSGDEEELTIADDVVVTKYKMAGDITNGVLKAIIAECKDGASARAICELGDKLILEETNKIYKKEKELKKGIGFPTCICINNVVCHFSPLQSETDMILKTGDLVKIDLGTHVDGFIGGVAHTLVVGASKENKVTGRKADVLLAAYYAGEVAQRLVKPGNNNNQVTEAITKVAEEFKCKPVEGMLSHQLKQNVIDGEKTIIQNPNDAQKKDHKKCEFELHEVYAIDVLLSTGDGKAKERETRTTVYKRTDMNYSLKMKASRNFYSEVCNKFTMMPFTLRAFEDEKKARLGVNECTNHELITPYPVLYEKDGEYVAQFKFTVLLMPNGPLRITHGTWDPELVQSEYSIKDEELKKILSSQVNKKNQKKKKKKVPTQPTSDTTSKNSTDSSLITPPVAS